MSESETVLEHDHGEERAPRDAADLADVLDAMEAVDWAAVPTVSTAEAAAWTARLVEARESLEESR